MSGVAGGPVTFLFSDIEGSTRLVKALRERYAQVLAEHQRLVRAAIAGHAGQEVDTQGDAFFVAFASAKQAVLCALQVQRALAAHDWPDGAPVRVRIGIHTGQAIQAGERYTGLAVHRAARICAAARGGQVLLSQATQTLIADEEEDLGFALEDLGEHQLKDLDRPVRLFQLAAAGLDTRSPPTAGQRPAELSGGEAASVRIRDASADPAGITAAWVYSPALTSFTDRAGPAAEVAGLLERHRLVTVTGPGGSGKTRLAGEVATQVAGRFADGVWLTELAAVADPALVASVVAAGLRIPEQPGVPAAKALAQVLARQQLLLVLDNCDHVIGAAAELCTGLLAACDDVRVLATSREPLAVAAEAGYRLAPPAPVRLVIAEDMTLLREGLTRLLAEAGFDVVGGAADLPGLLELVNRTAPDAALIDIKMPPTHTDEGLKAAAIIRQRHPGTAVLLLSSYLESRYASSLLEQHPASSGYLLKERVYDPAVLADALERVCSGQCVIDPAIVSQLLGRSRERGPLDELTEREREILALMAEGHSNHSICSRLVISPRTVESHVRSVFIKLGIAESPDNSRRVLAVLAFLQA